MTSAIPGTITALKTLWVAALPGVDVRDGWTLSGDDGTPSGGIKRRVLIGKLPESDDGVTFDRQWAAIGALRLAEDFVIPCWLECVSGDEDLTSLRDAAFTLLDALSAALATDNTLGGRVQQGAAVLGQGVLVPVQRNKGGAVGIRFAVECKTRINQ